MFTCQGLQTVPVYKKHDKNIENNCKYHYCQNKGTGNATNKQPANEQTENVVNNVKMPFIDSINHLENSPKKALALIGEKSCLYNSMETQN